jgi:uncharacterized protein (TIGR03437 family)
MLLLLAAIPAFAQFSQLAATDDGKQLYFASQLLLKGSTESLAPAEARLYRWGADGVSLFAERGALAPRNAFTGGDGVSDPQVSGDGSVVGFTFNDICPSSGDCDQPINQEGEIRGTVTQDLGPGVLQLSRNGQWALLTVTNNDPTVEEFQSSTLIDLTTGRQTSVPPPGFSVSFEAFHTVASNGTLLIEQNNILGLWKQGQFTPIQFPRRRALYPIALSDNASTLFLSGVDGSPPTLSIVAMNLASGKLTTVFQPKDATQIPSFMGASNNGQIVLYLYTTPSSPYGPAFIFNAATGASTPISLPSGELVFDGTLTGGGDFAFLLTSAGRFVRVTLATGAVDTLFPATPLCGPTVDAVPGSFVLLDCNVTGSVSDLQGQILVDGIPMPILYVTASGIGAQMPWEAGGSFLEESIVTLNTPNSSPFQASQPLALWDMLPQFVPADPGTSPLLGLKLIKADWSGLLTTQPAPGDVFYAYMTGLGPVNGPMLDGVPAPINPPAPILGSLTCQFAATGSPATTLSAGLAPGAIGFYQVAFQLPADAGPEPISCISCSWPGGAFAQLCGPAGAATPASAIMKLLPHDRRGQ